MDTQTRARYEARAKIMKAMAHPTRLYIVDKLADGEICVADLTRMICADVSTVSRHLAVLKAAGIVRDEKRRNRIYYSLRMPCVLNFFGCVEKVIKSVAAEQLALAE